MRNKKRQRGFKRVPKKFFYKEDIFISRMASVLKTPKSKIKGIFFQKNLPSIKTHGISKEELEKRDLELETIPWARDTYLVKNRPYLGLKKMKEYKKELFFVQDLSQLIATLSLKINSNDLVLDMHPESTTEHLFSFTNDKEKIFPNFDMKGEDLDKKYFEHFDKVLLFAPSSREGKVSFLKKRPLKSWSIKKTKALAKLQKELIISGFNCLKKGGLMAYATTTISPNENEAIVTYLLDNNRNATLEEISLIEQKEFESFKPFIQRGLKEWNKEVFHKDISKTIRTIPGKKMFGTYIALIRKT